LVRNMFVWMDQFSPWKKLETFWRVFSNDFRQKDKISSLALTVWRFLI
jgi:hypothetical protein